MKAYLAASVTLVFLASVAATPPRAGQDIVDHGTASGAPACISCHGSTLQGNPAMKAPPLAGKPSAYILARLAHYAGPAGHNAMMKQVATALRPDQRTAVAAYIATLPPTAAAAPGR